MVVKLAADSAAFDTLRSLYQVLRRLGRNDPLSRAAEVAVVQSTDHRFGNDLTPLRRFDFSWRGRVIVENLVGPQGTCAAFEHLSASNQQVL